MSKVAVVYWSGTGNTEMMAAQVKKGAEEAGAEVTMFTAAEFGPEKIDDFDAIAFGCPSMGAEVLEESEFDPMFTACEGKLGGKKIALFGSYGWGDGQWMRDWKDRMEAAGAQIIGGEGLMINDAPDDAGLETCKELGANLGLA